MCPPKKTPKTTSLKNYWLLFALSSFSIYINPLAPERSVINRYENPSVWLAAFTLFFSGFGFYLLISIIMIRPKGCK